MDYLQLVTLLFLVVVLLIVVQVFAKHPNAQRWRQPARDDQGRYVETSKEYRQAGDDPASTPGGNNKGGGDGGPGDGGGGD